MQPSIPYAGYVRVSAVSGRQGETFHSPSDQTRAITDWCASRDLEVTVLPPELDRSGGDPGRPILEQAVRGVEQGDFRGIVVAYLSRASRSVSHLLEMYSRVEAAGGQVIAVAENIDTRTPAGRLTRNMFAAMAEFELDTHRERFEALRRASVERGTWTRRQAPRGYSPDPITRQLVPNAHASEVLAAFEARATGVGTGTLADRLEMSPSGIRKLLANRVYLGELRDGAHINLSAHQAIVPPHVFEAVAGVATAVSRNTEPAGRSLLAGRVLCGSCGAMLERSPAPRVRGGWVYACNSRNRCDSHVAVVGEALNAYVRELQAGQFVTVDPVGRGRRIPIGHRVRISPPV
jgi:DNA invertase Pin-like site-specific DNA recombinase